MINIDNNVILYENKIKNIDYNKDCAIIITSTDKYSYIWEPFFELMNIYWRDRNLDLFWISDGNPEYLTNKYNINVYKVKNDIGFLTSYEYAARDIKNRFNYKHFLLLQDDYLIERNVNNSLIIDYIDILTKNKDIGSIQIMPSPGPTEKIYKYNNIELREVDKNNRYSFNFQIHIWNIDYFLKLTSLHTDEDSKRTVWGTQKIKGMNIENELSIHVRSLPEKILGWNRLHKKHWGVLASPIPYTPSSIVRGKLEYFAKVLLDKHNIPIKYDGEYCYNPNTIEIINNLQNFLNK